MRLCATDRGSHNYIPWLNGHPVGHCIEADEEAGEVIVTCVEPGDGDFALPIRSVSCHELPLDTFDRDGIVCRRLRGYVELRRTDGR